MTQPMTDLWIDYVETGLTGQLSRNHRWATPGDMAEALDPGKTRQTPALRLLDQVLVDLADGTDERVMFYMPPQEGKSERVSRRFPAWLLEQDPTLRVAIVSYEQEKAVRWGREIKRDVETHPELRIMLRADSKAAGRWHTTQGGGVYCVGIGGALTGEPVDVLIIDDPVKGRAQAESETYRNAAWEWWESVGTTRLSARGRVALIMTRWHEDDLAGRLMAREGELWRTVTVPAVADSPDDALGREIGVEMESVQGRKPGHFTSLEKLRSDYVWLSVYQQRPTAAKGNLFLRDRWRFWQPAGIRHGVGQTVDLDGRVLPLAETFRFATVDLAASTKTSADFTVCAAWAIGPAGDMVLLDRAKDRVAEGDHWALVRPLMERWQIPILYVESRMFGTTLVYEAGRLGIPIDELVADTDKLTRALPAVARVKARKVWLPAEAGWLDDWIDELAEFPNSRHDDQVDVMAYAARVAAAHWVAPGERHEHAELRREMAQASATVVDLMSAPF